MAACFNLLPPIQPRRHPAPGEDADADDDEAAWADAPDQRSLRSVPIIAVAALVLAIVAVGLAAVVLLRPAAASCEVAAWDAVPRASELPAGWTIGTTDIYRDYQATRLVGPDPGDGSGPASIYTNVTCFGDSAGDAVDRAERAAKNAQLDVAALDGVGQAGYEIVGGLTGGSVLHFMRGPLVAYVGTSGLLPPAELKQVGSAVDAALRRALGDAGATAAPVPSVAAPPPASPAGSPAASGAVPARTVAGGGRSGRARARGAPAAARLRARRW